MAREIKLPELGENVDEAEVLSILVSEGDQIEKDQTVLEVETDKASVEVPSPVAGVVKRIRVKVGDLIQVGHVLMELEDPAEEGAARQEGAQANDGKQEKRKREEEGETERRTEADEKNEREVRAQSKKKHEREKSEEKSKERPRKKEPEEATEEREQRKGKAPRKKEKEPPREEKPKAKEQAEEPTPEAEEEHEPDELRAEPRPEKGPLRDPAPAAPSVRRLARELGIDIDDVIGHGPTGRISAEDVKEHARTLIRGRVAHGRGAEASTETRASRPRGFPELPDFSQFGEIEREPMHGVRRRIAENMTRSWMTIPHVTQYDRADITALERARKRYVQRSDAGVKLTVTAIVIRVVASALKNFPKFNASLDIEAQEILFKKYVNIGVAVDTDHGLLVPVVHDVDQKSLPAIAREVSELSDRARRRKSRPEDLRGANITVTNLGGLGTTYFAPLVNWPEVAVVGVGRAGHETVYEDGIFVPRLILPLSVSYDHRLIDGADAARFLRWIAEALESPLHLALES
jgi:pyruvate dehydrogenase E2 component (dihydrolipoamide acetyltransferase)